MALSFGVTVLPDPPYTRMIELMQLAERHGFEYAWTYDSHMLWQESFATLPLAADRTERIKLGHFVTNPGIRDPTITASWYATMQDLSNGRMVMGIGRGDSSRRVVGLKPVRVAEFEARRAVERAALAFEPEDIVSIVVVDLLWLDGQWLLDVPLLERKRVLEGIVPAEQLVRPSPYVREPLGSWIGSWRAQRFQAMSFKAANSRYRPGETADDWTLADLPRR